MSLADMDATERDILIEVRAICIQAKTTLGEEGPLPAEEALERIIDLVFPDGR